MLRIDLHADRLNRLDALGRLNTVVRACFLHRRKMLGYNIRRAFPDAAERLAADGRWDLTRRPEDLTVAEWGAIAAEIS